MKSSHQLYEIIYISTLAPDVNITAVADIARHARVMNDSQHITGMLVFDGMRFCQQMEGTQKQVLAMEQRIRQDARHVQMEVLHHGPLDGRRFRCFTMGYSLLDDSEVLARMETLDGQTAVEAFLALLPHVDVAP